MDVYLSSQALNEMRLRTRQWTDILCKMVRQCLLRISSCVVFYVRLVDRQDSLSLNHRSSLCTHSFLSLTELLRDGTSLTGLDAVFTRHTSIFQQYGVENHVHLPMSPHDSSGVLEFGSFSRLVYILQSDTLLMCFDCQSSYSSLGTS